MLKILGWLFSMILGAGAVICVFGSLDMDGTTSWYREDVQLLALAMAIVALAINPWVLERPPLRHLIWVKVLLGIVLAVGVMTIFARGPYVTTLAAERAPTPEQSLAFYRQALAKGNKGAAFNIAQAYADGAGVAQSGAEAERHYRIAITAGDADAAYNLGNLFETGRLVAMDKAEAARLFQTSLDLGGARAANNLALLYRAGEGVRRNERKAFTLLLAGARGGDPIASVNLADSYRLGLGTKPDPDKAADYYRKALTGGDADAAAKAQRELEMMQLGL